MEEEMGKKVPRNKKSKNQLRDYLHTGRKRKTPYRDAFNGINGYTPYTPLNGYPACPTGEVKGDIMYPYTGNNFGLDTTADLYARTAAAGYTTFPGSGLYPGTADSLRLEAEKHAYPNGYYLEPRQYQHTLQYHGNGYTDYMSPSAKYPYDISKYGYEHMSSAYGLDLSKRTPYDEEISRYDTDVRKYSHDYCSDKYSRVNGSLDPLKTSSLYGTTPILNNDSLCNLAHGTASPCSLYRSDGSTGNERYGQDNGMMHKDSKPLLDTEVKTMPNGHASVIRNASPRTKSPRTDRPSCSTSNLYGEGTSVLTSCGNASWPMCDKVSAKLRSPITGRKTGLIRQLGRRYRKAIATIISKRCLTGQNANGQI